MSRILEGVFVLGCAVVGFCMDANEGNVMQDAVKVSVQFVSMTENRIATFADRIESAASQARSINAVRLLGLQR